MLNAKKRVHAMKQQKKKELYFGVPYTLPAGTKIRPILIFAIAEAKKNVVD
jgi:hypothetical protein